LPTGGADHSERNPRERIRYVKEACKGRNAVAHRSCRPKDFSALPRDQKLARNFFLAAVIYGT
jgi:hypothetical protein